MITDTFTYNRDFACSADHLWSLITDVNQRAKWGSPDDGSVLETLATDFQVGGVDKQRCGPAENPEFEVQTRWYNIDAPTTVVYTEVIEAGGMALGASLVTIQLQGDEKSSTASFNVAVSSFVGPEMIAEFKSGWDGGMAKLTALASAQ